MFATRILAAMLVLASVVVAQPPLLKYRFNEGGSSNLTLNEGTAGPGNHAVVTLGFSPNSLNGTPCLEGTNGVGYVPTGHTVNQGTTGWSLGFLLNTEDNDGAFQYVCGDSQNFRIYVTGSFLQVRGPLPDVTIPNAGGNDGWRHVVLTYHEVLQRIFAYVDGELVVSQATNGVTFNTTQALRVGGHTGGNSLAAGSKMEDFRFYGRTLGGSEIASWVRESGVKVDFEDVKITEVVWNGTAAVELVNFGSSANLTGWKLQWRNGTGFFESFFFAFGLAPDELVVIAEPGPLTVAPGTNVIAALPNMSVGFQPMTVALIDEFGFVVDEIKISGPTGGSEGQTLGGACRGRAVRVGSSNSIERIWGLDSNSGRDWTAQNTPSLGLQNQNGGSGGIDTMTIPDVKINEIDDNPDLIEIRNRSIFRTYELRDWFLLCSANQGQALTKLTPFPSGLRLQPGEYLVIGESATPPAELPAGVTYVNVGAFGQNIPFTGEELTCALYDSKGRAVDVVRSLRRGGAVVHNHPRVPAYYAEFRGAAPRSATGDAVFGRVATSTDTNRGSDFRMFSTRSMGSANPSTGMIGHDTDLDVRVSEGESNGLTLLINAAPSHAGEQWAFLMSGGHLNGTGLYWGLGPDSLANYINLMTAGFFGNLDAQGQARKDFAPESLAPGLEADLVFLLLDANNNVITRTQVIEFDT